MKFNFKIQQYQTDAVDAVVKVFQGQGYHDKISYIRDLGKKQENQQMRLNVDTEDAQQFNLYDMDDDTGYKNEIIELSDEQLLINIQKLQSQNNIKQSKALVKDLGRCSLDIEMETGTGKTYVYIKTMFELNKKYGWSKFIVVVPSIAIREGVKKTFEITADHFMEHYGKKARFFVYNSSNLNQLDNFSSSSGINVMVMYPSRICEESRFVKPFFRILRRKKSCSIWELSLFPYSLLMRLPSIVNMMRMVTRFLENMDRCLSRNI